MATSGFQFQSAIQDFRRARRRASLERLMSFLKGQSNELLSYEEVRQKLKVTGTSGRKLKEIPLQAIVGSVGRYKDFTRSFLPIRDSDQHRWATVQSLVKGLQGLPPIEAYQIGDVYFVSDGNHRVSVARQIGAKYIEAYVTEIQTRVQLSPDIQPDELTIKAEYAEFLSYTHLNELRPDADLTVSTSGKYRILKEQIEEHRYFLGMQECREIPYNEAVMSWYDTIYQPIIRIMQKYAIGTDFPNRTITDLYLWISEYRAAIRQGDTELLEENIAEIRLKLQTLPDLELDALILDIEYIDFLDRTQIEESRPEADLRVTAPGKYPDLEEHIEVHRYFMGIDQNREVSLQEAAAHWYDSVYRPIVSFIRKQGMLRDFPNRTEADLYLWISEHHKELEDRVGWKIQPEAAAADFANQFSPSPGRILSRVGGKVLEVLTPDELESGPAPGEWRRETMAKRRNDRLFSSILVPVNGQENGWFALEEAIRLAQLEDGQLYGLHVVPSEDLKQSEAALTIQNEFISRCKEADIPSEFVIENGDVAKLICERARWTDLVVLNLDHPPGIQLLEKLKSRFRTILWRCSRPVLAVPNISKNIHRALLAYDGSQKADEALFVGAYLGNYWHIPLVVVTVKEPGRTSWEVLSLAKEYLHRRNVEATFVEERGSIGDVILYTARVHECDLIIVGGYGRSPMLEMVLGSGIDQVLRKSQLPILICR